MTASDWDLDGQAGVRNILMVDDDPDVLRMLSASLSAAGFAVRSARSGDEALAALASDIPEFDAIVTDTQWPGWTGSNCWQKPISFIRDCPASLSPVSPMRLGCGTCPRHGGLSKPFRRMELVGRLQSLMDGRDEANLTRRHSPMLRLIT